MDQETIDNKIAEIEAMPLEERGYEFIGDIEMERDVELLNLYLERGVDINYKTGSGNCAIIEACSSRNLEFVRYFLSKGADVNVSDRYTYTPLRYAALFGDHEITKLLIEAGADIEYVDDEGHSILATALKRADKQPQSSVVIQQLIDAGVDLSKEVYYEVPLYRACKIGSLEIATMFIAAGVDVNATDEGGVAALSVAAKSTELTKLLLENGADASSVSDSKKSALTSAAQSGNVESMKLLIAAGGDINDPAVDPIINPAVSWGGPEMVKFLLDHGIELTGEDKNGKSVQDCFTDRADSESVRLVKEVLAK